MAEAIAFGIATNLLTKLEAVALQEICLAYGVEDELGKLKDTLSTIGAALLDADERKEKSHLMQDWVRKLNDVVYGADDLLDAFATKALGCGLNTDGRMKRQVREFFSSLNQLAFRYRMGHKIKEIIEKFDIIAADMSKFNFTERLIVQASVYNSDRETMSFVLTSEIIGREKDKEEIIKLLTCSNHVENVSVITIVGMGGLGKTALTQLVYNDDEVVKAFEPKMWVCVSDNFEIKSLVIKILNSTRTANERAENLEKLDLEKLQICVREKLDGKRFLLILDDIWNENRRKWELLKKLLMGGAKGSKIVVTTRSSTVASVMGTENLYILEGLTETKSWNLFVKIAFRGHEKVHPNLEVIGKEIIERCRGVPLAIQSLASVMQSKTQESEWLSIRNKNFWSLCQDDGDIIPILMLSYVQLPMTLRQCFSYCSIFPKDHRIDKEELIRQWMAQGYLQSSDRSQSLEDTGDEYFRNLLSRSFFQEVEVNDYNEVRSCKMHDLIHDLAVRVAGVECFIGEMVEDNISERVHHVSFVHNLNELPRQLTKAKGLRTYLHLDDWNKYDFGETKLLSSNFRCLRVLVVGVSEGEKVSHSIGKLQHLRYLELYGYLKDMPNSIGSLINLQTLKLSQCFTQRLAEGITKLINLRYLMNEQIGHMPSGLGKLTCLRRLPRFVIGGGDERSVRLSELNGLNELRGDLSIEGLDEVRDARSESKAANLMAKQYLHSLSLTWAKRGRGGDGNTEDEILLEGLQPHPQLRELRIEGYSGETFPCWMMCCKMVTSLPNIVGITLVGCYGCRLLPPSLHQLPFLKYLTLSLLDRVKHIDHDHNNLHRARNLSSSSSSSSLSLFFPSLEKLVIYNMPNLEGWWTRAEGTGTAVVVNDCLLSQQRPSFSRLTTLYIEDCPKLTSMPMLPPHIEVLELRRVPETLLRQLLTTTTTTMSTTEESEISSSFSSPPPPPPPPPPPLPLPKLRSLKIFDIEDLESLTEEAVQNLASLEDLDIGSCPRLLQLVAVSGKDDEEEEGFFRGLTSLRSLSIDWCASLTCLSPPETQFHLPALQTLLIQRCRKYDLSGDSVHWQGLRSLRTLEIAYMSRLVVSLPAGLQHATTLQVLEIRNCRGLVALPDWISNLSSLQMLKISGCPVLSERCRLKTAKDWPKIFHIPYIQIDWKVIQGSRG